MRTLKSILLIVLVFLLTSFSCAKVGGVDTNQAEQQASSSEAVAATTSVEPFASTSTTTELTLASGTPVSATTTNLTSTSSSAATVTAPVVEELERFVSSAYGVTFQYPKGWQLLTGSDSSLPGGGASHLSWKMEPLGATASSSATTSTPTAASASTTTSTVSGAPAEFMFPTVLAHVVAPQANYTGTNLVAAYGTLSVADASSEVVCSTFGYGQSPPIQTQATGNRYYYSLRMNSASGTVETARTLRTYQNSRCYEFDMAVYTASPSTTRSVDSESIFTLLANIAISLRYR